MIAVLTMTVVLGGCTNRETGNAASESVTESHRAIIDSDTGADNAMALLMAAKSDNITIEGVTVEAVMDYSLGKRLFEKLFCVIYGTYLRNAVLETENCYENITLNRYSFWTKLYKDKNNGPI